MIVDELSNRNGNGEQGFSLIELMIVVLIMTIILGILGGIVANVNDSYTGERPRIEALTEASAAMDTMARVIRMAGNNDASAAITPTGTDTIRIRGDWNAPDGALTGVYEDVLFTISGDSIIKREPGDATGTAIELFGKIGSLRFIYYDSDGNLTAAADRIARVRIELETADANPLALSTDVQVRNADR